MNSYELMLNGVTHWKNRGSSSRLILGLNMNPFEKFLYGSFGNIVSLKFAMNGTEILPIA